MKDLLWMGDTITIISFLGKLFRFRDTLTRKIAHAAIVNTLTDTTSSNKHFSNSKTFKCNDQNEGMESEMILFLQIML